jgi:F-type H+-transporting ATPase subunit b
MKIDWFIIAAQIINFLILIWLMRRFLFKPIFFAIDTREKRIATEIENAEKEMNSAQKERDELKHKTEEFDLQCVALLNKAKDEAQALRQRLLDEARDFAETLHSQYRESLRNEAHSLHEKIGHWTQQEVFAIVRKVLSDLAGADLEERLGTVLTRRLYEMKSGEKASFTELLATGLGPVLVRSAFDLPVNLRSMIQQAINETFSAEIRLQFETVPDLIAGIELNANGYKVSWSIAEYLMSMEKSLNDLIEDEDKRVQETGCKILKT